MNVRRHSLIFGLSTALDIAGRNNLSHSKSTAYLAVLLGRKIGLNESKILEVYYAALLHDIALSNSYEMIAHCVDGEKMLKKLPLPADIAKDVYYHHEYYNGKGNFGVSGDDIPVGAAIICFASAFDDLYGKSSEAFGRDLFLTVGEWLDKHRELFSGAVLAAFEELLKREAFLLDYFNYETKHELSKNLLMEDDVRYDYEDVVKYARCFADIIDCKSPFTYTHSNGIADLARKAAVHLGYDEKTQNEMYLAGLLHDIGKLHVPVEILHKNGKLTPEERFEINKHTYYTRKILEQIEGFEDIVEYAANHHEKLDGTGYPYRIPGEKMSDLEKVMAICDVYQALTEERPYRESLPISRVWEIIDGMAQRQHLEERLVAEMKQAFL